MSAPASGDQAADDSASSASIATTSAAGPRARTLIHFKKNSSHAVSQALAGLKWSEYRLRIPKVGAPEPNDDDDDDGEGADEVIDEVDIAARSVAAAAVSDVKSRPRKVVQPKSLLLSMASYTAFHPRSGRTCSAADLKWDIAWMDMLGEDEYRSLTRQQRINQFPLMHRLTKKKYLALNLNRMRAAEPQEYAFYPRSWVLPQELAQVKAYYAEIEAANKTTADSASASSSVPATAGVAAAPSSLANTPILIVKPDFACEGKGIYLVDRLAAIDMSIPLVVQQYVDRPLLLDGIKFDLRLYVLITSVQPLSIFLFDDGLTRFCTDSYVPPAIGQLGSSYQHLTNYAINKKNVEKFVYNTSADESDVGSKWSVRSLMQKLKAEGREVDTLWRRIGDLITKSILSGHGVLSHAFKTTFTPPLDVDGGNCFQFLGFDVLIEEDFSPVLIEINRNCSLKCDTPLDSRIKVRAITQTLALIDPRAPYRTKSKEAKEREEMRGLSGAAYKKAQVAQQQAKYDARLQYEDACLATFSADSSEGSFRRIHPLVAAYDDPNKASEYARERQAVYDRLMEFSIASHAETKATKKPAAARPAAAKPTSSSVIAKARSKVTKASGTTTAQIVDDDASSAPADPDETAQP